MNTIVIRISRQTHIVSLLVVVLTMLSGCASIAPTKPVVLQRSPVIAYALSLQGASYRYGKASPREGFDCSGFVQHVYEHHGIYLPRTTEKMAQLLPSVPKSELRSGDLVFFNTGRKPFSHVGIYVDQDDFIHAPSRRSGRVMVSSLSSRYWKSRFIGIRRPETAKE